ncbi:MAG: hypothetical protein ACM32F_03375 [Betaproteobacteria bacterium]
MMRLPGRAAARTVDLKLRPAHQAMTAQRPGQLRAQLLCPASLPRMNVPASRFARQRDTLSLKPAAGGLQQHHQFPA